jgi:hypothetical protein
MCGKKNIVKNKMIATKTATLGIISSSLLFLAIIIGATTTTNFAMAQTSTTTAPDTTLSSIPDEAPGAPPIPQQLQQVVSDAQAKCAPALSGLSGATPETLAEIYCLDVLYASDKTTLLSGDLLIPTTAGNQQNPFIWLGVDGFKALGYSITSVQLSGQGSQGNPHTWEIVMSK